MAKKILAVVAGVIVLLLAVVAMQPANFEIKRSATINAPADVVYAQVVDFKAWEAWSPWDKVEGDNLKRTYSEPSGGAGASYHWKGDKTGEGNMKLTEAKPNAQVKIDLDFVEPFPASNKVVFDLAESNGTTTATWSMTGTNNFMGKAFGLFFNMDKSVGGDFEKGLASIKGIAEKNAAEAKKAAEAAAAAEAAKAAADAAAADAGVAGDAGTP